MNWIAVIGTGAALCSTISFVPQAWRIVRTRDTQAISPVTYSFSVTGFALWTIYGFGLGEWPLIATNSACFVLSAFILMMMLLPRARKDAVADRIDPSS